MGDNHNRVRTLNVTAQGAHEIRARRRVSEVVIRSRGAHARAAVAMRRIAALLLATLPCAVRPLAISTRRTVLRSAAALAVSAPLAAPAAEEDLISVYFGCGCLCALHTQHNTG